MERLATSPIRPCPRRGSLRRRRPGDAITGFSAWSLLARDRFPRALGLSLAMARVVVCLISRLGAVPQG